MTPKNWNIFESTHNGRFNACVGNNSLHNLKTYADGYIEASVMLLDTVLDRHLIGQMDTLVHPILYSARHAIELTIKCVLFDLNKCDLKTEPKKITGHSLSKLWSHFYVVSKNDSRLRKLYQAIDPILKVLDAADPDAQDFRYPVGNAKEGAAPVQTLQGKAIVDLLTVRDMIQELSDRLEDLYLLAEIVSNERQLKSFTKELNRYELMQLAIDCGADSSPYFCETQTKWHKSHGLSRNAFRRATDFIKNHREFAGYMGNETPLMFIDPKLLDAIVEFKLQDVSRMLTEREERREKQPAGSSLYFFDVSIFADEAKKEPIKFKAYSALKDQLTPEVVAELETLYYLAYLPDYSENYRSNFNCNLNALNLRDEAARSNACMNRFLDVFTKTNLIDCLLKSLALVGQNTKSQYYAKQLAFLEGSFMDEKSETTTVFGSAGSV